MQFLPQPGLKNHHLSCLCFPPFGATDSRAGCAVSLHSKRKSYLVQLLTSQSLRQQIPFPKAYLRHSPGWIMLDSGCQIGSLCCPWLCRGCAQALPREAAQNSNKSGCPTSGKFLTDLPASSKENGKGPPSELKPSQQKPQGRHQQSFPVFQHSSPDTTTARRISDTSP